MPPSQPSDPSPKVQSCRRLSKDKPFLPDRDGNGAVRVRVRGGADLKLCGMNDIKAALRSAFGTMKGPLSVVDWCKGRSQSNDGGISGDDLSAESTASASECRDSSNTISLSVGEPISPSQSSASGSSSLRDGIRVDEASERRLSQDTCLSESENLLGSRLRPTLAAVPYPTILLGCVFYTEIG
ncbi:hypothetical protein CQW23_20287 [Capsicum baccatum]|uniref:Mediator of RNA polymerase II transcription subunit 13 n=1 Tax=Capsicum baccatum TaxID=33114 RepID=A0A2G2W868_CAPBA|nr:hypothetical protein CQW23_20287 [Capsicum baccatum]